jgi:hypothetical protein
MYFLHGILCWLTAHCWACRAGASWRYRQNPAVAGVVYISTAFLRFSVLLLAVEIVTAGILLAAGNWHSAVTVMLLSMACGGLTGFVHGSAEY